MGNWFEVCGEVFRPEVRGVTAAKFITKAKNRDHAIVRVEEYLEESPIPTVSRPEQAKTTAGMLDIVGLSGLRVHEVDLSTAHYYDIVPGDHTRMVELQTSQPVD